MGHGPQGAAHNPSVLSSEDTLPAPAHGSQRRRPAEIPRIAAPGTGILGAGRSDASEGAGLGCSGAALHLLGGGQLDVHVVPLDPDREDLDPVRLAAEALARFEREGLLVHGAGDLGDALLIAEDAAGEDRLAP